MYESPLKSKSNDPKQGVYFIGTTPPKQDTDIELVAGIADKLLGRLNCIDYDGLIVYDIQDETSRIDKPRPFPFKYTHDARLYSKLLHDKSGKPVITYKSVSQRSAADFTRWLSDAWHQYSVRDIVLVGSPSSEGEIKLSLAQAYQTLKEHKSDFHLGGVTIAERHISKGDEHLRLRTKELQGCEFFISQALPTRVSLPKVVYGRIKQFGPTSEPSSIKHGPSIYAPDRTRADWATVTGPIKCTLGSIAPRTL